MARFPTERHLLAWAGLCPGLNQSGKKQKSAKLRKDAPWLKTTMVQCATSAVNVKKSYFRAQFHRIKSRRGELKARCAVAASLLTTIYHMIRNGTAFNDLGADYFDRRPVEIKANRLVAQLAKLGYRAELHPLAQAA